MNAPDVLCFSHLRWNLVFRRPNHLMTRCARKQRVFFVEEPIYEQGREAQLEVVPLQKNLTRGVPHLPYGLSPAEEADVFTELLERLCLEHEIQRAIHWYYSPMFVPASRKLPRLLTVYDCMAELAAFEGAIAELRLRERELMAHTDVMFTGGMALYERKRAQHHNVHALPSGVDVPFFAQARTIDEDPDDQAHIPEPRIGYYGVIDERIDLDLLRKAAAMRPDWQFVMLGPVVKIGRATLPRAANIHYLGQKSYDELPHYAAGWNVAMMPFALNESTRFISPTQMPEFLAAGLPVVSTAMRDVVEPYERLGLARIARGPEEFVLHLGRDLAGEILATDEERDAFLAQGSWDATFQRMESEIQRALARSSVAHAAQVSAAE